MENLPIKYLTPTFKFWWWWFISYWIERERKIFKMVWGDSLWYFRASSNRAGFALMARTLAVGIAGFVRSLLSHCVARSLEVVDSELGPDQMFVASGIRNTLRLDARRDIRRTLVDLIVTTTRRLWDALRRWLVQLRSRWHAWYLRAEEHTW